MVSHVCKYSLVENTHTTHNQEICVLALALPTYYASLEKLHIVSHFLLHKKGLTMTSQDYGEEER